MRFPSAYKGTRLILIGIVLELIGTFLALVVNALAYIPGALEAPEGELSWYGLLAIVVLGFVGVLAIAALVVQLFGLRIGGNDTSYYGIAFWIVIISIVLTIVIGIFQNSLIENHPIVYAIFEVMGDISDALVKVYILVGIAHLAEKLFKYRMMSAGKVLSAIIAGLTLVSTAFTVIEKVVKQPNEILQNIINTFGTVAVVVNFTISVMAFIYLIFAVKMLKKN